MKLLVLLLLVFFVFSCSDSGDVDSGNINNTIDSGNVDGGNSDSSDSDDGIVRTWEQFPAFTAGKEVSKRTTIEPTIDGTIIRELLLDYENILRADIDAYANILLADGFTKVKEYNGTYDEYSKYAKSINGVLYEVSSTYRWYYSRCEMGFYVTNPFDASEVEISAKWDAFPKFTAGTLLSSAETQDDAFEYLNQYYANLSDADVDAYINKLLNDGFIKTPVPVAYEKVANGKRYRASVGVRKASFVMSDDITYNPDGKYILLSPKTQINKDIKYTLHYTPTGLETTCNDIEVINLRASNPLTPGATTWTTNIEFYATMDVKEPSKFYLYYTIHPVYMICDGEEVPVVFD